MSKETNAKEPIYFTPRDKKTGNVVRTPVYIDQEGNVYKDCDPRGLDMSGRRKIIGTQDIEIENKVMENNWISVNSDLPEYGKAVIWFDINRGMYLEAKGKSLYPLKKSITHWHEIIFPESPPKTI